MGVFFFSWFNLFCRISALHRHPSPWTIVPYSKLFPGAALLLVTPLHEARDIDYSGYFVCMYVYNTTSFFLSALADSELSFLIYRLILPGASNRLFQGQIQRDRRSERHAYGRVRYRNDTQLCFSFFSIARVARDTLWPLPCSHSERTNTSYLHRAADYPYSTSFILTQEPPLPVVYQRQYPLSCSYFSGALLESDQRFDASYYYVYDVDDLLLNDEEDDDMLRRRTRIHASYVVF